MLNQLMQILFSSINSFTKDLNASKPVSKSAALFVDILTYVNFKGLDKLSMITVINYLAGPISFE